MKTHQSECGVHSPSSHGGEGRTLRVRRAAETYLLALMPSLRVAKPSATSDSAMFSPLVSDKEKKETWILGLNPSPIAKGLYWDHFHPQLFKLVLPTNWTRQQAGVGAWDSAFLTRLQLMLVLLALQSHFKEQGFTLQWVLLWLFS